MMRPRPLVVALCLSACATPDITPQITAMRSLVKDTSAAAGPELAQAALAERTAAEAALTAQGRSAVRLQGACQPSLAPEGGELAECTVVSLADLESGPVNATQVQHALGALNDYFDSVAALAAAKTTGDVKEQTTALFDAIDSFASGKGGGKLRAVASGFADVRGPATAAVGLLVEQARRHALIRVFRRADPLVADISRIAGDWFDSRPGSPEAAAAAVIAVNKAMVAAEKSGDHAALLAEANQLRSAADLYQKALAGSPSYRLRLLSNLHSTLLARLTGSASPEEILATLEQMRAIAALLEK